MTTPPTPPRLRPETAEALAARRAAEAAALRDNLRRRHAQRRARADAPSLPDQAAPPAATGQDPARCR